MAANTGLILVNWFITKVLGNVGIGTTSPGAKLEINGTILVNGIYPDYTNCRIGG